MPDQGAAGLAEHPPAQQDAEDRHEDRDQGKRTRWPLLVLGVVLVLAAVGGLAYWLLTKDQETTEDAYTDGRAIVVSPHVAGYVTVLAVNDNQFVHKGDLLVQIEPQDYVAMREQAAGQLKALQAQLDNARVAYAKAQVTFPAQLSLAQGQLQQAHAQLFQTQRENTRQTTMTDIATTQALRDTAKMNFDWPPGRWRSRRRTQAGATGEPEHRASGGGREAAGRPGRTGRGPAPASRINLGYTRIVAAQDGWVTKRNVEVGSYLQPGQQIVALVLPEVWVTANFRETELDRMRPGQKVRIHVDAYPQLKLEGHVDSIQLGSGSRFTAFPPENATGNFVKIVQRVPVKIVIDGGSSPETPLPLGISVEPTVILK